MPDVRCPTCGALVAPQETICRRCFSPLAVPEVAAAPVTGETSKLYRSVATGAILVCSASVLEYKAADLAFHSQWINVASVQHHEDEDTLWLYHTPTVTRMPLGAARTWFSDQTRFIPLRQFGYPANPRLYTDLVRFAPQLQRYLREPLLES